MPRTDLRRLKGVEVQGAGQRAKYMDVDGGDNATWLPPDDDDEDDARTVSVSLPSIFIHRLIFLARFFSPSRPQEPINLNGAPPYQLSASQGTASPLYLLAVECDRTDHLTKHELVEPSSPRASMVSTQSSRPILVPPSSPSSAARR